MIEKLHSYNVGIFGAGQIGLAIREMLEENTAANLLNVTTYDKFASDGSIVELDILQDLKALEKAVKDNDIIISALPYDATGLLAESVINAGNRVYLDLTEDVEVARILMAKNNKSSDLKNQSIMIPHCGLAPGAVSIIAASLCNNFSSINNITIRVGALPISTDNALKYNLAWSTSGLVNEYCNPCPAVVNGEIVNLQPLDNLTMVSISGVNFEAFNTSGGLGTLGLTLTNAQKLNNVKINPTINARYQTLRYPGHRDLMKFLLDDLNFKERKEELITILDRELSRTQNDMVVIDIKVTGKSGLNDLTTVSYNKIIECDSRFTAIQKTTAGGVCAVVNWLVCRLEDDSLESYVINGSIRNELIPLAQLQGYKYWVF